MNTKKLSCGTIIVNEYSEILMGRVTLAKPIRWDLPKGVIDENEQPIDAAVRECQEEFGLALDRNKLIDLGHIGYNNDKILYLFITFMPKKSIDLDSLQCTSHFTHFYTHKEIIEVDDYAWVPLNEIHDHCGKSMTSALTKLYDVIENESKYGEYR